MKKTYRIKTNNQEQLQRKQNESDATSRWIEFQKTRPRRLITWQILINIYNPEKPSINKKQQQSILSIVYVVGRLRDIKEWNQNEDRKDIIEILTGLKLNHEQW